MSTQIFHIDFVNKKVLDKFLGDEKVVWYRCLCCQTKYAKTRSDKLFVPSISWSVDVNKRQVEYSLCKYCIVDMYEALNGGV